MPTPRFFLDSTDSRLDGDVAAGVDDAVVTVINTLIWETWLELLAKVVLDPVVKVVLIPSGIEGARVTTAGCDVTSTADVGKSGVVIKPRGVVFIEYTQVSLMQIVFCFLGWRNSMEASPARV